MKLSLEPSAQIFLDALSKEAEGEVLLNHAFDEANELLVNPLVDMERKTLFPLPHSDTVLYRILWGTPFLGRSFWYVYEPDEVAEVIRIHNIGYVGLDKPFLSRN